MIAKTKRVTKLCRKCGKRKRMTSFTKQEACKDGLKQYCNTCVKLYNKDYYQTNKTKLLNRANMRYQTGKEKQSGSE